MGRFPFNKKFRNEISGIPCDEWNSIFRLFRFSGILGQPREVHPKFRNETPENVCSIRSPTRNIRNFWSNGKRPRLFLFSGILEQAREVHLKFRNDIPKNVLSIRSSPGISGIFGRMESAPYDRPDRPSRLKKNVQTIGTIIWKRYLDDRRRPGRLRRPRSLG